MVSFRTVPCVPSVRKNSVVYAPGQLGLLTFLWHEAYGHVRCSLSAVCVRGEGGQARPLPVSTSRQPSAAQRTGLG